MALTLRRTPLSLALVVSASLLTAAGCGADITPLSEDSRAETLTSKTFSAEIAAADSTLAKLRAARANEKAAALQLAKSVQQRDRVFEKYVLGRALLASEIAHKRTGPLRKAVAAGAKADRNTALEARDPIAKLENAHRVARAGVEMQLAALRSKAKSQANTKGGSGVLALSVLAHDYTFGLTRRLPSLHTQVKSLRDTEQCRGDVQLEGLFDAYLRAVITEDERGVVTALGRLQAQLSCMSVRQVRALESAMVKEIDTTLTRTLGSASSTTLAATRFRQMIAIPLLLLADQNRALPRHDKPGLVWFSKNIEELARAASIPGTVLHRFGLVLLDARTNRLVPVSSKSQRARDNTKVSKGTKNIVFAYGKLLDTNVLPAFVRGVLEPCRAVDLVAEGSGGVATRFVCDDGCGKSLGDRALLGTPGISGKPGSSTAAALCGSSGGGGGTAPPGAPNGGAGRGGVTVGAGTSQTDCVMSAIGNGSNVAAVEACAKAQRPGAGDVGSLAGSARTGRESCRPTVGDEPAEGSYGKSTGILEVNGVTYNTYEDEDGDMTFVNADDPTDVHGVTASELADNEFAVEDEFGVAHDPPPEPTTPPESPEPPVPAASTPAAGGGSFGQALAGALTGSAYVSALGESLEDLEFMMQSDDPIDGQCSVNPQCMEPGAPQDCAADAGNCSTGCTTSDADVTAFRECLADATGTGGDGGDELDHLTFLDENLINPTPDSTGFSTLDGALLACVVGGTPVAHMCAGQAVRLCPEEEPNCGCSAPAGGLVAPPPNDTCAAIQCASNAGMGELSQGAPRGDAGLCGCGSVMGGR